MLFHGVTTYKDKQLETPRYGRVKGLIYNEEKSVALIDNHYVEEGHIIHGVKVVKILPDKILFEKNGKSWTQTPQEKPDLIWPIIENN
jgi:hypothetical protein